MNELNCMATCRLGLESVVAAELRGLGAQEVRAKNARVDFLAAPELLARANLWLRAADRVFLVVGEFPASSFDELFEGARALPWEDYILKDGQFPVKGKTAKSALHSVSDCQSIVKKAVVERLKSRYHVNWFAETGKKTVIEVGMLDDVATLAIDASGAGLGRRGYRTLNGAAPLAETLAGALALLARCDGTRPFLDPMCGSGTIAIEAALCAYNVAPGLARGFAAEEWGFLPAGVFEMERERARALRKPQAEEITASDIDPEAVRIAKIHAKQAGVPVRFAVQDVAKRKDGRSRVTLVTNPPYGERLLDRRSCEALYAALGRLYRAHEDWKAFVLCAHPGFEKSFGQRADKRRKLYNAGIPCQLYQYFKQNGQRRPNKAKEERKAHGGRTEK